MASRWERGSDKKLVERNQKILKDLLAQPGNKICVDCKKRDPRWASANLGVFMCLRCSGVHRSLGVHISKVRSVDLDTWTPEHVETMQRWGNVRANQYWEFGLPAGHVPDDARVESFIRNKYEYKKYVKPGPMPEPETLAGEDGKPAQAPAQPVSQVAAPIANKPDEWAAFAVTTAAPSQPPPPVPRLSAAAAPSANAFFNNGSAVPPAPTGIVVPPGQQQQQQQQPVHLMQTRGDMKNDILSLYQPSGPAANMSSMMPAQPQASPAPGWANNATSWHTTAPSLTPSWQQQLQSQPQSQKPPASPASSWAAAWAQTSASTSSAQPAQLQQQQQAGMGGWNAAFPSTVPRTSVSPSPSFSAQQPAALAMPSGNWAAATSHSPGPAKNAPSPNLLD